ncbi:MAG: hypothetical protein M1840_002720 [Geoglossum simile]|nr:MAG: hypothetical protein M1840_002720 [Geoglossum simile]
MKVSLSTLYRLHLNFDLFGQAYPPPTIVLGCPKLLLLAQELQLLDFLEDDPTAYLDEMHQFLYNEYELEVSAATVSRTLK